MSSTNCRLPSKGFCLNLRVRTVKSPMASTQGCRQTPPREEPNLREGEGGQARKPK